jgi:Fe-S-cluster-containing dehydrogenase component
MTIWHQKRSVETKCTECWDELGGAYSPACVICSGSGYSVTGENLSPKSAYVAFTQPFGNFGTAAQTFKAGGQHERMSAYVYMDFLTGRDVDAGDRLVINMKGYRQELSVMNAQPQLGSGGEVMMFLFECASPINKSLEETVG